MRTVALLVRQFQYSYRSRPRTYLTSLARRQEDLKDAKSVSAYKLACNTEIYRALNHSFFILRALSINTAKVTGGGCFLSDILRLSQYQLDLVNYEILI